MRAGRHVLFMDELITYDSAMAFLQVESLKDLFYAFADSDGRYGATLYYSSALVAVLGNAFGGDAGAILLIRMLLSVELAAAYLLLAFVLISNRLLSLVALLTLIFLPTTAYFATMPKPEPLQLLFLAIFLYLFVKRRQFFGWPWLFFGLAFGAKVSALFLLPVFVGFILLTSFTPSVVWRDYALVMGSIIWLGVGWLISVPQVVAYGISGLARYFILILGNVNHGADNAAITLWAWIEFFIGTWLSGGWLMGLSLLAALIIPTIVLVLFSWFHRNSEIKDNHYLENDWVNGPFILLCGFVHLLSPMLLTQRLWDFYLHNGFAIMLIGSLMAINSILKSSFRWRKWLWITPLLLTVNLSNLIPVTGNRYYELSQRSKSKEFYQNLSSYNTINNALLSEKKSDGQKLIIAYDPWLFLPNDTEDFAFKRYWGKFSSENFERYYDVIIAGNCDVLGGKALFASSAEDCVTSLPDNISSHIKKERGCLALPCYELVTFTNSPKLLYLRLRN